MTIPKYIEEKIRRADMYASKARELIYDVEKWMKQNGVDEETAREEWIFDECGGIGHLINEDDLLEYLCKREKEKS